LLSSSAATAAAAAAAAAAAPLSLPRAAAQFITLFDTIINATKDKPCHIEREVGDSIIPHNNSAFSAKPHFSS
jgi:hypothetical protein